MFGCLLLLLFLEGFVWRDFFFVCCVVLGFGWFCFSFGVFLMIRMFCGFM